ncbi:MAG: hypothetical protein CMI18_09825 [Opitutaceae bacterium]|nr:hypothetical protein [Opitutaceae bacterium]
MGGKTIDTLADHLGLTPEFRIGIDKYLGLSIAENAPPICPGSMAKTKPLRGSVLSSAFSVADSSTKAIGSHGLNCNF